MLGRRKSRRGEAQCQQYWSGAQFLSPLSGPGKLFQKGGLLREAAFPFLLLVFQLEKLKYKRGVMEQPAAKSLEFSL